MIDQRTETIIERAAAEVERQTEVLSRQPRFTEGYKGFGTFLHFLRREEIESPPPYVANSQKRDKWLRDIWKQEPHLAGVVNAVTLIDANRGWTLVGGRNQVLRYNTILHQVEAGAGWRTFIRKAAQSYWCTDLGSVTEVGRDGPEGPLRALYHVDSARCRLTGSPKTPLEYHPPSGGVQYWEPSDYFHIASMPSDDEALRGLGFCAVSRCIEIMRLLYAVLIHDQEQVGARAPKGLLLLEGISEDQWNASLQVREQELDSMERRYYGGVQVLASSGMGQINAKLVALSQLPANFDAKQFTDLSMYAMALCFGYDPSEFWPVQFGSLGRGTEAEVQQVKATAKGGLDFALHFQEQLQWELPETLQFEFEQRDDQGEMVTAALAKAKLQVITAAYQSGLQQGAPLISRDEARSLLAEQRLIPPEWTEAEEDFELEDTEDPQAPGITAEDKVEVTDTEDRTARKRWRERLLDSVPVQRAMDAFPREPIVAYSWPEKRLRTVWDPRVDRRKKIFHPRAVTRQDGDVLYEGDGVTITEKDVDNAIAVAKRRVGEEFAALLTAPVIGEE